MLKKAADYLGLGPDDQYDIAPALEHDALATEQPQLVVDEPAAPRSSTVRPVPVLAEARTSSPTVRPIPVPISVDPEVIEPTSFGDAQRIADEFMAGRAVIMNLRTVDRDLSRRLIDFASGVCYTQKGRMERVANQVFLISPAGVDVAADARLPIDLRD